MFGGSSESGATITRLLSVESVRTLKRTSGVKVMALFKLDSIIDRVKLTVMKSAGSMSVSPADGVELENAGAASVVNYH